MLTMASQYHSKGQRLPEKPTTLKPNMEVAAGKYNVFSMKPSRKTNWPVARPVQCSRC